MRQLLLVSATKHPWLLPALGLALFVHKHFLSVTAQHTPARLRPGPRSRPPKLKRKPKHQQEQGKPQEAIVDAQAERLDAAGLAHDRLMEWFTEDEVEALHQAHANPAAMMSLLSGTRYADVEGDDVSSQWSTDDEGLQQGLGNFPVEPLQLLQDSWQDNIQAAAGSSLSAGAAATEQQQQQQQQHGNEQQSQLVQELLLQVASARQQLAHQPQQQRASSYVHPAAATGNSLSSPGAEPTFAAAADMQQSPGSTSDYSHDDDYDDDNLDDAADQWDCNNYFALSPAAAAAAAAPGPSARSPGHFLPRANAPWASSYAPRFGEELQLAGDDDEDADLAGGADLAFSADLAHSADLAAAQMAAELAADLAAGMEPPFPDWEPDLGDWDFDAPDFDPGYDPGFGDGHLGFDPGYDPGFDDSNLGFDFDEELCRAALAALAPAAAQPVAAGQA